MDVWKITMLGSCNVGKTTIARQFAWTCDLFVDIYDPSLEDKKYRRRMIVDNKLCFVEVLDDDLEEDDPALSGPAIENSPAQAFILIYSISDKQTFERVQECYYHLLRKVRGPHVPIILVGNKCDQQYKREVSKEEGEALANKLGCKFYETSAKTAQNVERSFVAVIRLLRAVQDVKYMDGAEGVSGGKKAAFKCVIM